MIMKKLFHGSPYLFHSFSLDGAGDATGVKFGYGVYLTEVEASAVHYSQPRNLDIMPSHYLYTVEVPSLVPGNHLVSARPVESSIVERVEAKLGISVPADVVGAGKEFRKWVGRHITGATKVGLSEEKAAAEFLDSIGVHFSVWPTAQNKPDGPKNIVVFNADNVTIVKREHIEIEEKGKKWVLVSRKEI